MRRLALLAFVPLLLGAAPAPVGGAVRFEAATGTLLALDGRSFRGALEVKPGMTVVNHVDLESYMQGLAEVPGSWPMEALKAQAVAARTYVLWEKENGSYAKQGF